MYTFIVLFIFMSVAVANSQQKPPSNIVFYLHIDQNTMITHLAANRSTESSGVRAILQAIEYPMSRSANRDADIGTARGLALLVGAGRLEAVGRQGEVLLATIDYDDGIFEGSINLQGHFAAADPDAEVAVVGGTHAFRRVQGYGNPSLISQSSLTVVRWELHLFYPTA